MNPAKNYFQDMVPWRDSFISRGVIEYSSKQDSIIWLSRDSVHDVTQ
jgi:hypothetical protein